MKVGELDAILDRIQKLYLSAGAKGPAKDLQTFRKVLHPHFETPVNEFVAFTKRCLDKPVGRTRATGKVAKGDRDAPPNESAIKDHVTQLRGAGNNKTAFDRALETLKSNKTLMLAEFAEIARQYANTVTKYRTITSAEKDIFKAFLRASRFEEKLR